jgi:hypothetical protein
VTVARRRFVREQALKQDSGRTAALDLKGPNTVSILIASLGAGSLDALVTVRRARTAGLAANPSRARFVIVGATRNHDHTKPRYAITLGAGRAPRRTGDASSVEFAHALLGVAAVQGTTGSAERRIYETVMVQALGLGTSDSTIFTADTPG